MLVSAVHGIWPAVSRAALLPRANQRYPWLIPACTGSLQKPYPAQTRRWPNASATMQRLAFRRAVVPVSLRYNIPIVPPAGLRAAPKNRDWDSPGADKALISPWTMSIGHLLLYIDAPYSYQSTSGTTFPLYHLQVPVQLLRIVTETAHGRRTSTLAENRYLPMSTVHSSRRPMHYVRSQHITGSQPWPVPLRSGVASRVAPVLPCGSNTTSYPHFILIVDIE